MATLCHWRQADLLNRRAKSIWPQGCVAVPRDVCRVAVLKRFALSMHTCGAGGDTEDLSPRHSCTALEPLAHCVGKQMACTREAARMRSSVMPSAVLHLR